MYFYKLLICVCVTGIFSACTETPTQLRSSNSTTTSKKYAVSEEGIVLSKQVTSGVVSAGASASATDNQVLAVEDVEELTGSQVLFPPGSLAIDTNVSIQAGASIAEAAATALDLGGAQSLTPVGGTLVLSSSVPMDLSGTVLISLPYTSAGLHLDSGSSVIVLFKVHKHEEDKYSLGLIPPSELIIENGLVKFKTSHFGSYQLALAAVEIKVAPPEVDTKTPILTKAQEVSLPKIEWTKISGKADDTARTIDWQVEATGFQAIATCIMISDRDKVKPWDHRMIDTTLQGVKTNYAGSGSDSYYFKILCEESSGRSSESAWSDAVSTKALVSTVTGLKLDSQTTRATVNGSQTFKVSGLALVSYAYAYLETPGASCDKATYTAFVPIATPISLVSTESGSKTLCVRGKDVHGNVELPGATVQWNFLSPALEPGTPISIVVDPSDDAFLQLTWAASSGQSSSNLAAQNILIYDTATCAGAIVASLNVSKAAVTTKWHRYASGKSGPFFFQVAFTDTTQRTTRSQCSGPSVVNSFYSIPGTESFQGLGDKVLMQDVTGDGRKDIISYHANSPSDTGYVAVLRTGPTMSASDMKLYTGEQGDYVGRGYGVSVVAGDINGDGIDDIVIGSQQSMSSSGSVQVVFGSTNLPSSNVISNIGRRYIGSTGGDSIGSKIMLNDMNKDGILDIVVGAPYADIGGIVDSGAVYVIFGSGSLPANGYIDQAASRVYTGDTANLRVGENLYTADLTGDGKKDLIAWSYHPSYSGYVAVFTANANMPPSNTVPAAARVYTGDNPYDYFGSYMSFEDVTGDGILDLLTGQSNVMYLLQGAANLPASNPISTAGYRYHGENGESFYSFKIADFNRDGIKDIISSSYSSEGVVSVLLMSPTPPASGLYSNFGRKYLGNSATQDNGIGVNFEVGDVTGDGFVDIVVGSQYALDYYSAVYVIPGAATPIASGTIDQVASRRYTGTEQYQYFGGYRMWLMDLTGDGVLEIITSSSYSSNQYKGMIWVLKGQGNLPASGDWTSAFNAYEGEYQYDSLGQSVQFVDINKDGKLEILAASSGTSVDSKSSNGSIFVITGGINLKPSGPISVIGQRINGSESDQRLGSSIEQYIKPLTIADLNGDGYLDLVNSSRYGYNKIQINYGKSDGHLSAPTSTKFAPPVDPLFAAFLTLADVNGDGKIDILSSTAFYDGMYNQISSSKNLNQNGGFFVTLNQYLNPAP